MENNQYPIPTLVAQPNSLDLAQPQCTRLSLALTDLQVEPLETRLSMIICDIPGCFQMMGHQNAHCGQNSIYLCR